MTNVVLSVELIVDLPNTTVSATVRKISDSSGADRTKEFTDFALQNNLSLSTQVDIEKAVIEFAKARQASLP